MKINEADYVVAVDAANYRQILTAHQAVVQERDQLAAQVEQLKHTAQQLEMVLKQYTVYEWREIGETDWEICSQDRLEYCQLSPEHDTRKRILKAAEIKAQAVEDAAKYLSESISEQSHESVIFKDRYVYISTRYMREYANQLRQQAKGE